MKRLIHGSNYDEWLARTKPTLDYVDATLRHRRTAIDVGAAEGLITTWLAERFNVIHAFEPVPEAFALLSTKDWGGKVICHNGALGDRSEIRSIQGTGHAAHITDQPTEVNVQVTALDSFDIPNVDLIKIDVEGFETRVLLGAWRLIHECRPMIMCERKHLFRTRYRDESLLNFLERHGYKKVFTGSLDTVMAYPLEATSSRRWSAKVPHCTWPRSGG